jgi:hypothetical protein
VDDDRALGTVHDADLEQPVAVTPRPDEHREALVQVLDADGFRARAEKALGQFRAVADQRR